MLQAYWPSIVRNTLRFFKRTASELKRGEWIQYNSKPHFIVATQSVQSGRSSRVFFLHLKAVDSESVVQVRPSPSEAFELTEVHVRNFIFQYQDDSSLYLLNEKTFEEAVISKRQVDKQVFSSLEPGQRLRVKCENDTLLFVEHSRFVSCTVKSIEMLEEKKSIVELASGMQVSCPPFIKVGDVIQVDTQTHSYTSRVEEQT